MTKSKSKKAKTSSSGGSSKSINPSPTAIVYNGPVNPPKAKMELDTVTMVIPFTGLISSTAGGVIDSSYSDDPSGYGNADWTSATGLYHEYRILGLRVEFFPLNRYSKVSTNCAPMITVIDRAASGTLGSYLAAMNHGSAEKSSLEDPWTREVKMSGIDEADFIPIGSPVAKHWIKFYADGLSVSASYGRTFVYCLVQFRGRK